MSWKPTRWDDSTIVDEEMFGGTRVRLSYPDGTVIIGKLTVAPNLRATGAMTMIRLTTQWSGDTWIDAKEADVEIWETDAFTPSENTSAPD